MNVNIAIIAGNMVRDPDLKYVGDKQTALVLFTLAVNVTYKGKKTTSFIPCKAFGRCAEIVKERLSKGSTAYVKGRFQSESWEDKEGKKRHGVSVIVEDIQFGSVANGRSPTEPYSGADAPAYPDENIPY